MAKPASPPRLNISGDLFAMGLVASWLLIWRHALGADWGFTTPTAINSTVTPGILTNAGDTWSYLSWVQQYRNGSSLAAILYTTEPHPPLLWVFPLWVIGKISAITGLPALGLYNAGGVAAAMAAVVGLRRAAIALGLPHSASHWSCIALFIGSGGTWVWHSLHKLHLAAPAQSPETHFLDLFPSTTFIAYGYHAIGLALLIALWWQTATLENRLYVSQPASLAMFATAALALALAFSRPYEPIAFLGAWSLKGAWLFLHRRRDHAAWRAARSVGVCVALAFAPGLAWSIWVANQPVWSGFAGESLALGLGFGPGTWLLVLAGWLLLAVMGARSAWQTSPRHALLPISATLLFLFIVVVLGSGRTKLASGLALGPIFLAGWGARRIVNFAAPWPRPLTLVAASVALAAAMGVPSLFLALQFIRLQPPAQVEAGLWTLARSLPVSGKSPPVVLAGNAAGTILPGVVGARVWAGHFSLTDHYLEKSALLRAAGLDPDRLPSADAVRSLDHVLARARFDFALLDDQCYEARTHLLACGWHSVRSEAGWALLAAPRALP